jgi:hypothetical protein
MDVLGPLKKTSRGNIVVLVVADLFTKWIEAYPLPNQEAETVARTLVGEFMSRYGVPRILHSDQGRNFESKLTAEICKLLGIEKTRTCPYRPQANGFVERANRTILDMLAKMIRPDQDDWDLMLPLAMMAYRSSVQETIQETPNMMMLGREVTLPIDLMMGTKPPEGDELKIDYAQKLREDIQIAHDAARENQKSASRKMQKDYLVGTRGRSLTRGDFVWLFDSTKKKGLSPKLQSRWTGPWIVTKKLAEVVYRIQLKENGKFKVVHFDRLKCYTGPTRENWLKEDEPQEEAIIVDTENETILPAEVFEAEETEKQLDENEELLEDNRELTSDDPGSEEKGEIGLENQQEDMGHEEIVKGVTIRRRKRNTDGSEREKQKEAESNTKVANPEMRSEFGESVVDDTRTVETSVSGDDRKEKTRKGQGDQEIRRNPRRQRRLPRKYLV